MASPGGQPASAVVFDIDGTISSAEWRRHLADTHRDKFLDLSILDAPVQWVMDRLDCHRQNGELIVLLSSRPESRRDETVDWLALHGVQFDLLLLRDQPGPTHVDFKLSSLLRIRETLNIVLVYDDNLEVTRGAIKMGIDAVQVHDPNLPPRTPQ